MSEGRKGAHGETKVGMNAHPNRTLPLWISNLFSCLGCWEAWFMGIWCNYPWGSGLALSRMMTTTYHTLKGSGTLLVRLYKDAGTPSNECSLSVFWQAVKLLSLVRFDWFKKPGILIRALPSWWNHLKDLGDIYTLQFAPTLPLKSTIFTQLTEVWINLDKICIIFCEVCESCEIWICIFCP